MENLEHKLLHAGRSPNQGLPVWIPCVVRKFVEANTGNGQKLLQEKATARGVGVAEVVLALASPVRNAPRSRQ